jgi:hypothetical protein
VPTSRSSPLAIEWIYSRFTLNQRPAGYFGREAKAYRFFIPVHFGLSSLHQEGYPMHHNRIWIGFRLLLALAVLLPACAPAAVQATPQPAAPPPPKVVEQTVIVEPTARVVVATPLPTSSPTVTATPRPTRTPDVRPTQQYEAMKAKVEQYVKDAYLTSSHGTYQRLKDFSADWAQLGWYQWQTTGFQPSDFVIESDVSWVSASSSATLAASGCGFVFHANGENNHYAIFLQMDGYVNSASYYKGYWVRMGKGWFGKAGFPRGKAHIALVVEREKYYVFVNDKLVKRYTGFQGQNLDGDLAFVVLSGTNADFGTACTFSNTDLWVSKE